MIPTTFALWTHSSVTILSPRWCPDAIVWFPWLGFSKPFRQRLSVFLLQSVEWIYPSDNPFTWNNNPQIIRARTWTSSGLPSDNTFTESPNNLPGPTLKILIWMYVYLYEHYIWNWFLSTIWTHSIYLIVYYKYTIWMLHSESPPDTWKIIHLLSSSYLETSEKM